jgi:rRNA maturation endonuclease Nob1
VREVAQTKGITNMNITAKKIKSDFEVVKSTYKICPNCTNFQLKSHRDEHCNVCGALYISNCPSCIEPIIYPISSFCPVCGTNLKKKD